MVTLMHGPCKSGFLAKTGLGLGDGLCCVTMGWAAVGDRARRGKSVAKVQRQFCGLS
jgi:hypothetical protein